MIEQWEELSDIKAKMLVKIFLTLSSTNKISSASTVEHCSNLPS